MIAKKDWELIKAIKNHKCCGKDSDSSDNEQGGGGNTPSGDITIDDVVKFMHDDLEKNAPPFISEMFPYTTWNDIPDYEDANEAEICKTNNDDDKDFDVFLLNIASYYIGFKKESIS